MQPIQSIADLPFVEWDAYELLNVSPDDDAEFDDDYYGFGYARVDTIALVEYGATEPLPPVRDALLLVLHSADEPEPLCDDIELEFFVEEVHDDYSVTVLLSDFLRVWLPRVSGGERVIVLVLCNPHRAVLPSHPAAHGVPVYYATGDVQSSLDDDGGRPFIQLIAESWRQAE